MQPRTDRKATAQIAASKKRTQAERLLRQADQIEAKGNAYIEQSAEEVLERFNSWTSYLRRTGKDAKTLGKFHKTDMYADAMKLYRYLVRRCRHEAKQIAYDRLCDHMDTEERHVRMLLDLLKGKSVKIRYLVQNQKVTKILPGFPVNEHGHPLITVKNGGSRPNIYAVAPPPQFESYQELEDSGLLG